MRWKKKFISYQKVEKQTTKSSNSKDRLFILHFSQVYVHAFVQVPCPAHAQAETPPRYWYL